MSEKKFTYPNFPEDLEFKEPHFTRYIKFIKSRSLREITEDVYTEKHHIVPKSLGGSNEKDNLIILTLREHFIAHMILWKGVKSRGANAFWYMAYNGKYNSKLTARQYQELKKDKIERNKYFSGPNSPNYGKTGINNPNYGRHHTKEFKKKLSEMRKGIKNPFYGKKHPKELQEQIIEKNTGRRIIHKKDKIKTLKKHDDINIYLQNGWEEGYPLSYKKVWMNNGNKSKLVLIDNVSNYLENGWEYGRAPNDGTYKSKKDHNKGKITINNGHINKLIFKEDIDDYLRNGWEEGVKQEDNRRLSILHTEATKQKISNINSNRIFINNGLEEKRVKVSDLEYYINQEWSKGRLYKFSTEKKQCPHCGKWYDPGNYAKHMKNSNCTNKDTALPKLF